MLPTAYDTRFVCPLCLVCSQSSWDTGHMVCEFHISPVSHFFSLCSLCPTGVCSDFSSPQAGNALVLPRPESPALDGWGGWWVVVVSAFCHYSKFPRSSTGREKKAVWAHSFEGFSLGCRSSLSRAGRMWWHEAFTSWLRC